MADLPESILVDPFPERIVGYCTNVHAGATLDEYQTSLAKHVPNIRRRLGLEGPMPIGLWLSNESVSQVRHAPMHDEYWDWFDQQNLTCFTFNAFPYGDFHENVVKHKVYRPDWSDLDRVNYTCNLLQCLRSPENERHEISISTVPVGWGKDWSTEKLQSVLSHLSKTMDSLGTYLTNFDIHVDLEPEPGCYLDRSEDVVAFFDQHLVPSFGENPVLNLIRVCHDICHAAVMFEDQAEMFKRYDDAGIRIGKVQVSNAIRVDFDALSSQEKPEALRQLKAFQEDRYLHQTCIRDNASGKITFHEDLPLATRAAEEQGEPIGEWRVHFHVPIYLESFGLLGTTRDYIDDCLELMKPKKDVKHFEVETYAWNVLPE
ncbi:MAG: metabolite traffic protein EboE, partial [Planctomycetota bacterium]|nr:metabolite traffic protein EboE [Planctomycetota bacterium]